MAFIRVTISERGPTFVTMFSPRPAGSISLEEELDSLKTFLRSGSGIWQSHVGDIPVIDHLGRLMKRFIKKRRQARISRLRKRS